MPATRSSSRLAASAPAVTPITTPPTQGSSGAMKRKSNAATTPSAQKKSRTDSSSKAKASGVNGTKKAAGAAAQAQPAVPGSSTGDALPLEDTGNEDTPVPAVLAFSFEEAKSHLIGVDARFQDLFDKMACRPFEHLEQVHPFRALTISILGQQISWKAARSITHKFIRLYNPDLPEQVTDESRDAAMEVFPTPHQVADTDPNVLRTAGLSARKAEYIQDLAKRFADGRLSTAKLRTATDEELAEMLIQVKGIGKWTVDMFAIFSLRRPDILPVGDLGVQRGMVRWFLSQHSAAHPYGLSPEKLVDVKQNPKVVASSEGKDLLPGPGTGDAINTPEEVEATGAHGVAKAADAVESALGETILLPTPFTPSIHRTLKKAPKTKTALPTGLNVSVLKSRLDGKKVKGAFLTPQEMTDLTEVWKPYRSLGVYYMWSLADPSDK